MIALFKYARGCVVHTPHITIKDIKGDVIYKSDAASIKRAVEKACVSGVNLSGADLRNFDLRGARLYRANLSNANLSGSDLSSAYLCRADLRGTDLSNVHATGADFSESILECASLVGANLRAADLISADLSGADLSGAHFNDARLQHADLRDTDLLGAVFAEARLTATKFDDEIPDYLRVVPKEGEFIGWKKCRDGVIVKLRIPADAERSNAFARECRASKVIVLEVIGAEIGVSLYCMIKYRVGETVYADKWDSRWWNECSNGIHFFMTREEAEKY